MMNVTPSRITARPAITGPSTGEPVSASDVGQCVDVDGLGELVAGANVVGVVAGWGALVVDGAGVLVVVVGSLVDVGGAVVVDVGGGQSPESPTDA